MGLNIENPYRLIFYLNPDPKHAVQHYTTLKDYFHQTPMRCMGLNIDKPYRLTFYLNPDAKHAVQHYTTLKDFFHQTPMRCMELNIEKPYRLVLFSDKRLKAFPISTQGLLWGASYNI